MLGVLTVAAFSYVGQSTQDALLRAQNTERASEAITLQLVLSHLWLEEALAGDARIDVQVQVRDPLDRASVLCDLRRQGRSSPFGPLRSPSDEEKAEVGMLCNAIGQLVGATDARLEGRASAGTASDVAYDAVFDRALSLSESDVAFTERQIQALTRRHDDLRFLLVVIIFVMFVAGFVLIRRYLRQLRLRSDALADAYEKVEAALGKEREFERLRGEMVSNISHELRTPLVPILGWSQLLSRRPPDDPQRVQEYASIILKGAERLSTLIEDFLKLPTARHRGGRVSAVTLEAVLQRLADEIREQGGHPRINIDEGVGTVMTNRRALLTALSYLADNAVKFGPDSGPVDISATRSPTGETIISLIDDGPGLPDGIVGDRFELFVQGDGSTTRAHGGTGTGLFLAAAIVEGLGGRLRAENEPGRGARLSVSLPPVSAGKT